MRGYDDYLISSARQARGKEQQPRQAHRVWNRPTRPAKKSRMSFNEMRELETRLRPLKPWRKNWRMWEIGRSIALRRCTAGQNACCAPSGANAAIETGHGALGGAETKSQGAQGLA